MGRAVVGNQSPQKPAVNYLLWTLQGLLAALFLFAGTMKFIVPIEEMTKQIHMSGAFLHFIGVMEILGGLGLLLPGIFKIQRRLTVLAALGLFIIMAGATAVTWKLGMAQAITPLVCGLLLLGIAYGRRSWM